MLQLWQQRQMPLSARLMCTSRWIRACIVQVLRHASLWCLQSLLIRLNHSTSKACTRTSLLPTTRHTRQMQCSWLRSRHQLRTCRRRESIHQSFMQQIVPPRCRMQRPSSRWCDLASRCTAFALVPELPTCVKVLHLQWQSLLACLLCVG